MSTGVILGEGLRDGTWQCVCVCASVCKGVIYFTGQAASPPHTDLICMYAASSQSLLLSDLIYNQSGEEEDIHNEKNLLHFPSGKE